jgi:hypothetical protein
MATPSDRLARVDVPPASTGFFHPRALEVVTLVLLLIGGLLPGLGLTGWVVGAVLLWLSVRWTAPEKLVATIIWPGGLGTMLWFSANERLGSGWSAGFPEDPWAVIGVVCAAVIQLAVLVALWLRSGRRLEGPG